MNTISKSNKWLVYVHTTQFEGLSPLETCQKIEKFEFGQVINKYSPYFFFKRKKDAQDFQLRIGQTCNVISTRCPTLMSLYAGKPCRTVLFDGQCMDVSEYKPQ